MQWTEHEGKSPNWILNAAPEYAVDKRNAGAFTARYAGTVLGERDTADDARSLAQSVYRSPGARCERAQAFLERHGWIEGDHHRQWVITQTQVILAGGEPDMRHKDAA
jgi:hypothetical protein